MESTSSLQSQTPSPVSPRDSTASRVSSQDYVTAHVSEEYKHYNHSTISSMSSTRSYFLLENAQGAAPETVSLDMSAGSDIPEKHNIGQHETAKSMIKSDVAVKGLRIRDVWEIMIKYWLWEVAACIFSLASLASIVAVLIYGDGKPLDQWAWSSPTVVVSFIGTLGKASLVLVLSQVLSQLKWLHFREMKSLRHVRIFDQASRGPLGAVQVVLDSKKPLASIAACLVILTILVDPFFQLVFAFPSRLVEDDSQQALFYHINDWNVGSATPGNPLTGQILQRLTTSISEGLTSMNDTAVTASCPSGNCAWPGPIKTLGVCGSCADVAADVKVSCLLTYNDTQSVEGVVNTTTILACDYVFDDDHIVQAYRLDSHIDYNNGTSPQIARTVWNSTVTNGLPSATNSYPLNKTIFELDGQPVVPQPIVSSSADSLHTTLYNLSIIQLPMVNLSEVDHPMEMPAAKCWNCEMYLCEKSFEAIRVTDNAPVEYTVSTKRLGLVFASDGNFDNNGENGYYYGLYPSDVDALNETVWNFRYRLSELLDKYMLPLINSYSVEFAGSSWTTDPHFWGLGDPLQGDESRNVEFTSGLIMSKDLNTSVHLLTDSLTEAIRTTPNATSVIGQSFVTKSFIHVRWAWLALPLMLSVVTCVLLLIVAIKSHLHEIAVWKDDPLALLFHHVAGADIPAGGSSKTGMSDLDKLANKVHVRLDGDTLFKFVVSTGKA